MKRTLIILFFTVLIFPTYINGQRADLDNLINALKEDDPDDYKEVMVSFVEYARNDDVESMVSITSTYTIKKAGLQELKKVYENDTIPFFKDCKDLSDGGDYVHVTKEETGTGPGWLFRKSCTYKVDTLVNIEFLVLKEYDKIVMAHFGLSSKQ
ncbi:MAG: hypothetical protein ABUK01_14860 [Leptospirales bacterium]